MTALDMDMREITDAEIDDVAGGPVWFVVGALLGAAVVGGGYLLAKSNNKPAPQDQQSSQ